MLYAPGRVWRLRRAVGAALLICGLTACASGREPRAPAGALPPRAAIEVDRTQFHSEARLRAWQEDLDRRGLRDTGSPAHEAYVDTLHQRLREAGVPELYFEPVTMTRWEARRWSLELADGTDRIRTAGYIPYSGSTGAQGLVAPMRYLSAGQHPDRGVAGSIVVVELPKPALTSDFFHAMALYKHDPANALPPGAPYARPYQVLEVLVQTLDALQAAGAAGVVAVLDEPADLAAGLYAPYDRELRKLPGVYVDREAGARLKALAASGARLRLVLDAQAEEVVTRNLIGIIPGASSELTVINSHTDGTNGIEDNGPNAIVDIAQYLARLPREALPRSIMIMLSSGHFAGGVGIQGFLARHREDGLRGRIASIVTIEHLGATEWLPGPDGRLAPTGRDEPAAIFLPRIPALVRAASAMLRNAQAAPAFVMPPLNPDADGGPNSASWPGEGQYFWGGARLPTLNYITGPDYLLNYGVTTADKVDYGRMRRETAAITQLLLDLSREPYEALRDEQPPAP
ncbi:PA domain protein [Achromobacter sp. RTa]|uniref:PA domain protein n=1 Tax=Achromobacter sp. RTa TaxID=1532557 RepID=UPI00050F90E0|nr:PA domain protein [Achromobacter sp. RTa]KGD95214.1 PA domain protein [Achromobacter sp. RTa]